MKKLKLVDHLDRIASALEDIARKADMMSDDGKPPDVVIQNDSLGSCPSCDSIEVDQRGSYPNSIYRCKKCSLIWVNDADSVFKDQS